jgi:hypothetical protein
MARCFPPSRGRSVACDLATVNVNGLTGNEIRILQVENRLRNVIRLTHAPERMEHSHRLVRLRGVKRRLDHARRHGIHPNATAGVFDGKTTRRCGQAALW